MKTSTAHALRRLAVTALMAALGFWGCDEGGGESPDGGPRAEAGLDDGIVDAMDAIDSMAPPDVMYAIDAMTSPDIMDAMPVVDGAADGMPSDSALDEADMADPADSSDPADAADLEPPPDMAPALEACRNGRDDDADGLIDAVDPGCAAATDDDERDPPDPPACANGRDDDLDGAVDGADPDCVYAGAPSEGAPPACANGLDDDDDGRVDAADPGCAAAADDDERDPPEPPACANGRDDDLDGATDGADPDCVYAGGPSEGAPPACANGLDDDGDGRVDRDDPGCFDLRDRDERDPATPPLCANGIDDDRDGAVDYPLDPDCTRAGDDDEGPIAACANGLDDDGDGRADRLDPGCATGGDDDEADPPLPPACANGLDDDLDGATDYPRDPECTAAGDDDEGPRAACADGLDGDGDGLIDRDDPGCVDARDPDEADPADLPVCANGLDDDLDGAIDRDDPDCVYAGGASEGPIPACANGLDDDGDGRVDRDDPGCRAATDEDERDPPGAPGCADGIDNDLDGRVDLDDPDCVAAGAEEGPAPACANGRDDDGDGRIDRVDPGCGAADDDDEADPADPPACANGRDDDLDGRVDLADPDCAFAGGASEGLAPACANGLDDDGDGAIDRFDPGCSGPLDPDEADPPVPPGCADGLDGDLDGAIDLDDPDCAFAGGASEGRAPACANGLDDDGDGRLDLADPGCVAPADDDERDPFLRPTCADGFDNDGDGDIDLDDPDCPAAGGSEGVAMACGDGLDNDGDGLVDGADPGCIDRADEDEADPPTPPECANGLDDDGDGAIDYPADADCLAAGGVEGPPPACANRLDDDGDGRVDHPDDPGCEAPIDTDEGDDPIPPPACANGLDDDLDGLIDFPVDPDCTAAADATEGRPPPCADGLDDDGDGRVDLADPGCTGPNDVDERDPPEPPACANGLDDDLDGAVDFPLDPSCVAAGGVSEGARPACANGVDDDGDGRADLVDPGCVAPTDDDEADPLAPPACANGLDDDGDGAIDFPADPSCAAAGDDDEGRRAACDDGLDDDGDGRVDADDPGCADALDDDETDPPTPPACADGRDNDGDGAVDYPDDGDCARPSGASEGRACPAGVPRIDVAPRPRVELDLLPPDGPALLDPGCGPGIGREVAVGVAVSGPGALRVLADAPVVLALRRACGAADSEVVCVAPDAPAEPDAPAATVLEHPVSGAGEWVLVVQWLDAGPPPPIHLTILFDVSAAPACSNQADDDGDGRIDLADPGCRSGDDPSELDPRPLPTCSNGLDDDGDGLVDHPLDPDCVIAADTEGEHPCPAFDGPWYEAGPGLSRFEYFLDRGMRVGPRTPCWNSSVLRRMIRLRVEEHSRVRVTLEGASGVGFGFGIGHGCVEDRFFCAELPTTPRDIPLLDAGVYVLDLYLPVNGPTTVAVEVEVQPFEPICDNDLDDDGDGLVDAADPGCRWQQDSDEQDDPQPPPGCANGLDDDGDGQIDHPLDPDCVAASRAEGPGCAYDVRPPIALPLGSSTYSLIPPRTSALRSPECAPSLNAAQAFSVTLDRPSRVYASNSESWWWFVRRDCRDPESEILCANRSFSDVFEPGDYTLVTGHDSGHVREMEATFVIDPIPDRACDNGRDDDDDGLVDLADPGCARSMDDDEEDPEIPPACANGLDDDGDGQIDFPLDADCGAAGDPREWSLSNQAQPPVHLLDGARESVSFTGDPRHRSGFGSGAWVVSTQVAFYVDRPSWLFARLEGVVGPNVFWLFGPDGLGDLTSPVGGHVVGPGDYTLTLLGPTAESGTLHIELVPVPRPACDNGLDDDDDGRIDAADPGCLDARDDDEGDLPVPPACADGVDNDGDGRTDYPSDLSCPFAGAASEARACPEGVSFVDLGAGGQAEFETGRRIGLTAECASRSTTAYIYATGIRVDQPSQVTISSPNASVYLRRQCAAVGTEIACASRTAVAWVPRGEYYAIAETGSFGDHTVSVEVQPLVSRNLSCLDGLDNDRDGLVDLDDPGCTGPSDFEDGGAGNCSNGVDDDGDGYIDYPDDSDCDAAGDSEWSRIQQSATVYAVGGDRTLALNFGALRYARVSIYLPRGGAITAETLDAPGIDPALELRGLPGGATLTDDDGGPGLAARIESDMLPPGTYTLEVDRTLASLRLLSLDIRITPLTP